jgi:hypothetical protein
MVTHANIASYAWSSGDLLALVTSVVQLVLLGISAAGTAYVFGGLIWKLVRIPWRQPTPTRRAFALAGVAAILATVAVLWAPHLPTAGAQTPLGVKTFDVPSRKHVRGPIFYPQRPPVGGNHSSVWQNCGFYGHPIANEHGVHSLEHGAVWITYRPDLSPRQVVVLRDLAHAQRYVLVSPFPNLPTSVVASSWGRQLRLGSVYDARLREFVSRFRLDDSAPEHGGPCSGGIGNPQ